MKRCLSMMLLALTCLWCAGCFDAMDINRKDITSTAVIDRKNGQYIAYVEIARLSGGQQAHEGQGAAENQGGLSFSTVEGKGKTLNDMRQNLETKLDRPLMMGTVRVLVLTVDMAKEGIIEYLNRMREDVTYRKTGYIVTTMEPAQELLDIRTENEVSVGNSIDHTLQQQADQGMAAVINTNAILEHISSSHSCFALPNIGIEDEDTALTGYSVIQQGYYRGFIPNKNAKGLVCFLNDHAVWTTSVPYGENTATVEVKRQSKKIKPHYQNGKVSFDVDFTFQSRVKYLTQNDGFGRQAQNETKNNLKKMLKEEIAQTVLEAQKTHACDYLDFVDAFRIAYPHEYEGMDWDAEFPAAEIQINIHTDLDPGGSMDYEPPVKS